MDKDQKHIPFAVIVAATNGDETAIQEILDFYDGYISKLSLRKLYDEYGNVYMVVDSELKGRIQAAAICCVFRNELEKYFYARKKHKRKGCIAFLCFIICTCYMMKKPHSRVYCPAMVISVFLTIKGMSIMRFFQCGYLLEPQNKKTLYDLSTELRKKKNGGFILTAIKSEIFLDKQKGYCR